MYAFQPLSGTNVESITGMALHSAYKTPANFSDLCAAAASRLFARHGIAIQFRPAVL